MFKKLREAELPNVLHSKIRILKITITIPGEHETLSLSLFLVSIRQKIQNLKKLLSKFTNCYRLN